MSPSQSVSRRLRVAPLLGVHALARVSFELEPYLDASAQTGYAAARRRSRTVPPELPRGSGDAALASPAGVPKLWNMSVPWRALV
jgi:hypothetical protein